MTREQAFSVLGLKPDATPAQIRARWRKLAMQYHPDKNPGNKTAEAKFKQINIAHQIITTPQPQSASIPTPEPQREKRRETFQDFVNYANFIISDLERFDLNEHGRQQIAELKKTLQTIIKMRKFVNCAYISSISGMLGMFAYNQIFGYDTPHTGLVVYPIIGATMIGAAITQDKIKPKIKQMADLIHNIIQNIR